MHIARASPEKIPVVGTARPDRGTDTIPEILSSPLQVWNQKTTLVDKEMALIILFIWSRAREGEFLFAAETQQGVVDEFTAVVRIDSEQLEWQQTSRVF
jgi:hypothetical protein